MARRGTSAQGGAVSVPVRSTGPAISERAWVATRHVLEEFGDMMILTGKTIRSAIRPPYPYGGELVSQFLFTLRLVCSRFVCPLPRIAVAFQNTFVGFATTA